MIGWIRQGYFIVMHDVELNAKANIKVCILNLKKVVRSSQRGTVLSENA